MQSVWKPPFSTLMKLLVPEDSHLIKAQMKDFDTDKASLHRSVFLAKKSDGTNLVMHLKYRRG